MLLSIERLVSLGACDPDTLDSWGQAFRELFGGDSWEGEWTPAHQAMLLASPARRWWGWLCLCMPDFPAYSMKGWNLIGARLDGASLIGARLNGARLKWANLTGADLRGLDLEDLRARGAIF